MTRSPTSIELNENLPKNLYVSDENRLRYMTSLTDECDIDYEKREMDLGKSWLTGRVPCYGY